LRYWWANHSLSLHLYLERIFPFFFSTILKKEISKVLNSRVFMHRSINITFRYFLPDEQWSMSLTCNRWFILIQNYVFNSITCIVISSFISLDEQLFNRLNYLIYTRACISKETRFWTTISCKRVQAEIYFFFFL
jgi:hypothetical protein